MEQPAATSGRSLFCPLHGYFATVRLRRHRSTVLKLMVLLQVLAIGCNDRTCPQKISALINSVSVRCLGSDCGKIIFASLPQTACGGQINVFGVYILSAAFQKGQQVRPTSPNSLRTNQLCCCAAPWRRLWQFPFYSVYAYPACPSLSGAPVFLPNRSAIIFSASAQCSFNASPPLVFSSSK
jgi:hypothetical protein